MSKGKSATLLSIISVIIAAILVMSFIRFPVGIKNYNSLLGAVELDYDLGGGVAYTLTLSEENENEVEDIDQVIDVLEYRLGELGYSSYTVKAYKSTKDGVKDYAVRIETRAKDTLAADIQTIVAYGDLKFYGGVSETEINTEILTDMSVVKNATYKGEVSAGAHQIDIEFTDEAREELLKLAASEAAYYFKVSLDDGHEHDATELLAVQLTSESFVKNVMSLYAPEESSAKQLVLHMQGYGLPFRYDVDAGEAITSPYGEDAGTKAAIAIIALAVVLMAALVVIYKGFGISTALSTLLFIIAEGWLLIGVPNIVLNMGGVLGVMASTVLCFIGMQILGRNVKDAYNTGKKTVKASIKKGFKDSLVPTISINVVAGLIALALFSLAKGMVQSFAITFGIGVVVALVATTVFTRMFDALLLPLYDKKENYLGKKDAVVETESVQEEA